MLRKLGLIFAVLALFSIAGGHWATLQTVAWAGMLRDYAQRTGSVTAAVEQTFDGQHPCELCRQIAAAKAREHKESPSVPKAKDDAKVKALVVASLPVLAAPTMVDVCLSFAGSERGSSRTEQPPVPPPRRVAFAA